MAIIDLLVGGKEVKDHLINPFKFLLGYLIAIATLDYTYSLKSLIQTIDIHLLGS